VPLSARYATDIDWTELGRDFRPWEVVERDDFVTKVGEDLLIRRLKRRVRIIRFVHKEEDRIKALVWDLGPPTGEDDVLIPVGEATDLAHVMDLIEAHYAERMPRIKAERAARAPDRDRKFREGLINLAEEMEKQLRGASTFGYGGKVQREAIKPQGERA
jgi:hypothetical protein